MTHSKAGRAPKALAVSLAAALLASGCTTGGGQASYSSDQVHAGMTYQQVGERLGEPDEVGPWIKEGRRVPGVEWKYVYSTPFTLWIAPTLLFFTGVLTIPAVAWCFSLGMSRTGILWVRFGPDGRVLETSGIFGASL